MAELSKLTWFDARKHLKSENVALLPVGSTEQHGPHLPLGTDWLTAEWIAKKTEEKTDILLLPTIPVGVSEHHRHFWGTLWVSPATLKNYVVDVGKALKTHGISRLVIVNGHGGNNPALDEACRELRKYDIFAFTYSWWLAIPDILQQIVITSGSHAGESETSVMMSVCPEGVVAERFEEGYKKGAPEWGLKIKGVNIGYDTIDFTQSGVAGNPTAATREKGEIILNKSVERLVEFVSWLKSVDEDGIKIKEHLP